MQREAQSHKGDNGVVAVIGGCRTMHGAPIFSALAAEASGVDLIHIALPSIHARVAKDAMLNGIVHPFEGENLESDDTELIVELLASMDCAVIGPGMAAETSQEALNTIMAEAACPLVLDAGTLHERTLSLVEGKDVILTPHLGELERMQIAQDALGAIAQNHSITVFLKGATDHIFAPDGTEEEVHGGNAGLTVGGTGDVLAGLICGLRAQRVPSFTACVMAGTILKRAGEILYEEKGYAYTATDVIMAIPHLLHTYDS